jgi:hypothetical protein
MTVAKPINSTHSAIDGVLAGQNIPSIDTIKEPAGSTAAIYITST